MNGSVHDTAASLGIPVVASYEAFGGPDGDRAPVASGDAQDDQLHLTQQGVDHFVDLFVSGGFAPVG